jgi:hypothetical protein
MNPLIGKIITSIDLAADRQAIRFILADGSEVTALCDGDCCSHTWIEDVINPEAAIGSEVLRAQDIELPEEFQTLPTKTDNYEDSVQFYGFEITTAKGTFLLAYRNSSNGYYGGSLEWGGEGRYYGGVYGQNASDCKWQPAVSN